jgi:hypothetical protein
MNRAYAIRALKLSITMVTLALVGEGLFQAVEWLIGTRTYTLFLYAGFSAVFLPFVPLDQQAGPVSPFDRLLVALVLFIVVCGDAMIVSIVNHIGWNIGSISLAVLPLWYVGTLALLAGDLFFRSLKRRRTNGR